MTRELDPDNAGAGITTLSGFPVKKLSRDEREGGEGKQFLPSQPSRSSRDAKKL